MASPVYTKLHTSQNAAALCVSAAPSAVCFLRASAEIIERQVNGSGINQRAAELFVSSGGRAALFGDQGDGKIAALFTELCKVFWCH